MNRPNIPRSDRAAAGWMRIMAQLLVEDAPTYHVDPATAAEVMEAVTAFRSALARALMTHTRTRTAVQEKTDARVAAERLCRRIYTQVRNDVTISNSDRMRLGVRPRTGKRSPSGAPKTRPTLDVVTAYGKHRILWRDETTPNRRAKPEGCAMLQLFVALGPTRTADLSRARLVNAYTTSEVTLSPQEIGPMAPGERRCTPIDLVPPIATFFARWSGPRGQPGPWSQPMSLRLAA